MTEASGPGTAGIDWSHLMEQFDGDLTVICDVVEAYAIETKESLEQIPDRLAKGETWELRRRAHTLGATMRMFGLGEAERVARELETLAASGSLAGAQPLVDELIAVAAGILPELERFVATGGEPAR